MTKNKILLTSILAAVLTACGGGGEPAEVPRAQPADATNAEIGEHVVHFSALGTDALPPEIAKTYNIVRSKNRAMLNVTVVRGDDGSAVAADVAVKTANLTGQAKNVPMRRINEGDAIYYIGVTPVANQETLIFDITVTPEGVNQSYDVRFQRQFYTD